MNLETLFVIYRRKVMKDCAQKAEGDWRSAYNELEKELTLFKSDPWKRIVEVLTYNIPNWKTTLGTKVSGKSGLYKFNK